MTTNKTTLASMIAVITQLECDLFALGQEETSTLEALAQLKASYNLSADLGQQVLLQQQINDGNTALVEIRCKINATAGALAIEQAKVHAFNSGYVKDPALKAERKALFAQVKRENSLPLASPRRSVVDRSLPVLSYVQPTLVVNDGVKSVKDFLQYILDVEEADRGDFEEKSKNFMIGRLVEMERMIKLMNSYRGKGGEKEQLLYRAISVAVIVNFIRLSKLNKDGVEPSNTAYLSIRDRAIDGHPCAAEAYQADDYLTKCATAFLSLDPSVRPSSKVSSEGFSARVWNSKYTLVFQGKKISVTYKKLKELLICSERVLAVSLERSDDVGNIVAKNQVRHLLHLQRAVMLQVTGLPLKGMLEGKGLEYYTVLDIPHGSKSAGLIPGSNLVKVIPSPFSNEWLKGHLESLSLTPSFDADGYAKHGYVIRTDSSIVSTTSTFSNGLVVDGNGVTCIETFEGISKVAVRMTKQDKRDSSSVWNTKMDYVVIAASPKLYAAVQSNVATVEELEVWDAIYKSFVGGAGAANKVARTMYGTHRQVSCEERSLGSKMVVGQGEIVLDQLLWGLALLDSPRPTITIGLASVKSKKAKANLVWTSVMVNGVEVLISRVTDVGVSITDSAMTNAWEKIPQELIGLEGHTLALVKRVSEVKDLPLMQMVYKEVEATKTNAVEVIKSLQAQGLIKRKHLAAHLNVQMLQSMRTQYGEDQVSAVLAAALLTKRGQKAATVINGVMDLVHNSVDEARVKEVSLTTLVRSMLEGINAANGEFHRSFSINLDMRIVYAVVSKLVGVGKDYVRLVHGDPATNGSSVLIPAGEHLVTSFESVDKGSYQQVSGLLADTISSLWRFVDVAAEAIVSDEGVEVSELIQSFVPSDEDAVACFGAITKARDNVAGKALARVSTHGSSVMLVTSAHLENNEVFGGLVRSVMNHAEREYNSKCGIVGFKSPTIMAGQVRRLIARELHVELGMLSEEAKMEALLDGTAAYVCSEATVAHGDDADGDSLSLSVLPLSALLADKLDNKQFINPLMAVENPGYKAALEHLEGEAKSLVAFPLVLGTPNQYPLTAIRDAVIKAGDEKTKVALFSASQMRVNEHSVKVREAIEAYLGTSAAFSGLLEEEAEVVIQSLDLKEFANLVATFGIHVQGCSIQTEAMDRIKLEAKGVGSRLLSELLSPTSLRRLAPTTPETVLQDVFVVNREGSVEKLLRKFNTDSLDEINAVALSKAVNSLKDAEMHRISKEVAILMRNIHNYSLEYKELDVLMAGLDSRASMYPIVARALVHANMIVGVAMQETVSLACEVMRETGEYTSRRSGCLTTMLEREVREVVEFNCVQEQLVAAASMYRPS